MTRFCPCISSENVQLLDQDLRRVQGDVQVFEHRLEVALEEERQRREAFEAEQRRRAEEEQLREGEGRNVEEERLDPEDELEHEEQSEAWSGDDEVHVDPVEIPGPREDEVVKDALPVRKDDDELSVDFVGEDEDDNVWQQADVYSRTDDEGLEAETGGNKSAGQKSD